MSSRSRSPLRLGVLVSGSGTNLQALLDRIAAAPAEGPGFGGEVVVVGSDRADAGGLARAQTQGIPTAVHTLADTVDRPSWEAALRADLESHQVDAVILAGFMRILSNVFLEGWPGRVLNAHPSLLPAFRGAHAVRDALTYGVKLTGSTIHLVDEQVDHGPIVAQEAVVVQADDTEASLHDRIKAVEHRLLPDAVELLCHGRLVVDGRHVHIIDPADASPPEVAGQEPL